MSAVVDTIGCSRRNCTNFMSPLGSLREAGGCGVQGLLPKPGEAPDSDFHLVRCNEPEVGVAKLLEIVARRIPARFGLDPIRHVQVLCPMNRGGLGARSLNLEMQRLLNSPGKARVERFGWNFRPGDAVMQGWNGHDKEMFNGDLRPVARRQFT